MHDVSSRDYIESPAARRRMARLMAAQVIYSRTVMGISFDEPWDIEVAMQDMARWRRYAIDDDLEEQRADLLEEEIRKFPKIQPDRKLLKRLVEQFSLHHAAIDAVIIPFLNADWSLEKLDPMVATLLRMAVFELLFETKTPTPIIIKEYVELSAASVDEKSPAFIHAVIDKISQAERNNH